MSLLQIKTAALSTLTLLAFACTGDEPTPLPAVEAPALLVDDNPDPDVVEVSMTADTLRHNLGGEVELGLMAYNGSVPGPLLQAKVGDEIIVHFTNDLDEPTTIHWHGLRISDDMDGTPRVQNPVQPGEAFTYRFTAPEAGSYWYHPHVRSYEQVERGLYGPIVIHGEHDPHYDLERYMMLDDILLDDEGLAPFMTGMQLMHGRSGNALLNNGVISQPILGTAKQGQVERWRIVNPSNARTMSLSVKGANVRVIGTDGGLLHEPYTPGRITVAVGQRYDLEIAYLQPGTAELVSHVLTLDENDDVVEVEIPVAQVEVAETGEVAFMPEWTQPERFTDRETSRYDVIEFDAVQDEEGNLRWRLNGEANREDPLFTFDKGETVQLVLRNLAGPEHPFHLHGQFFRIVNGDPGLKDTVLLRGGQQVTIEAYLDNPGQWMAHCHILEHAELGMMSEIVVEE